MALCACCLGGNASRAAKDGSRRAGRRNSRKCRNHRAGFARRGFVQPDLSFPAAWKMTRSGIPAVIFLINGSSAGRSRLTESKDEQGRRSRFQEYALLLVLRQEPARGAQA